MITLALIALATCAQAKELFYEGPDDATEAQLQKAAKALTARCEACDLKGMKAVPEAKRVRVTCPKEPTEEMVEAVDFLASFSAAKVELRFIHKLGKSEAEKYPFGGAAPDGASWVKIFNWERTGDSFHSYRKGERDLFWLFRDKPILDATGKIKVLNHKGGTFQKKELEPGLYLEFPKDLTRALWAAVSKDPDEPGKDVLMTAIIIDGIKMETGDGIMKWYDTINKEAKVPDIALWSIKELTESKTLPCLLKHPLPFALKRAD